MATKARRYAITLWFIDSLERGIGESLGTRHTDSYHRNVETVNEHSDEVKKTMTENAEKFVVEENIESDQVTYTIDNFNPRAMDVAVIDVSRTCILVSAWDKSFGQLEITVPRSIDSNNTTAKYKKKREVLTITASFSLE